MSEPCEEDERCVIARLAGILLLGLRAEITRLAVLEPERAHPAVAIVAETLQRDRAHAAAANRGASGRHGSRPLVDHLVWGRPLIGIWQRPLERPKLASPK